MPEWPTMPEGGTLALDLNGVGRQSGSAIGWAYGPLIWKNPQSGYWKPPDQGGRGARYAWFATLINDDVLAEWKPRNVCIENPLPPNIPNTNAVTMRQIYAILGLVEEACWRASIPFSGEHVDTMRVNVIGRCRWPGDERDAIKNGVRDYVRNVLRMDVSDHNEADAIICWHDYRQRILQIPSAKEPLFRYGMAR